MPRKRRWKGIREHGAGFQSFIKINGRFHQEKWDAVPGTNPPEPPLAEIDAWRKATVIEFRDGGASTPESFAADAVTVRAHDDWTGRPSTRQYTRDLLQWVEVLGGERTSASVTTAVIEKQLERFAKPPFNYSPVTIYHRRSVLMKFFEVLHQDLDPKPVNPVLDTTVPDHWEPKDQSEKHPKVRQVLDTMRDYRYVAPGIRKPSMARLRAAVVMATGIPPGQVLRLTRANLAGLEATPPFVTLPRRKKGKGTAPRRVDLLPDGQQALRDFVAGDAWGDPNWTTDQRNNQVSAMSRCFKRAAKKEHVLGEHTEFHLYGARHSFAAEARRVADLDIVTRLIGLAPGSRCATQYTIGAHAEIDAKALKAMADARAESLAKADAVKPCETQSDAVKPRVRKPQNKLPAKLPAAAKPRLVNTKQRQS